jgi:hypothetical protein
MRYRLFLDEVGNDDIGHVSDERHRYFSLTGVIMGVDYADTTATTRMNALKEGTFTEHPSPRSVILHRKDIMHKKGPFGILADPQLCSRFDDALIGYIQDLDFRVITAVIDKRGMISMKYWKNHHPYHYLMEIIVEKYARFLEHNFSIGDIMPEKRQGKKDSELQTAYDEVVTKGTRYVSAVRMKRSLPVQQLKFRSKRDDIAGLQLCDLIAHPSQQYVRTLQKHPVKLGPFAERVVPFLVKYKYHRSDRGSITGFGIKYFP